MIVWAETCRCEVVGFCFFYLMAANFSFFTFHFSLFSYLCASLEGTHVRKNSNKFGFLLTYSYLCPHKDQLYDEKTTTYLANHSYSDLLICSGEGL